MRRFIGIVFRTAFALCCLAVIAAGALLYRLHASPVDITSIQNKLVAFLARDKPVEAFTAGGQAFFDVHRKTLNITFRQARLSYTDGGGNVTRAEIPLITAELPLTPGDITWLQPVITFYNAKLYPPPPPPGPPLAPPSEEAKAEARLRKWRGFLGFLDEGGLADAVSAGIEKAALLKRFGALCAKKTRFYAVSPADGALTETLMPSICAKRQVSFSGKETLEVSVDAEKKDLHNNRRIPAFRAELFRTAGGKDGLAFEAHSIGGDDLRSIPYIGPVTDALPFKIDTFLGNILIVTGPGGRPDLVRLRVDKGDVILPEGDIRPREETLQIRDIAAECTEYCTRFVLERGHILLKQHDVRADFSANLRAGSVTLKSMARNPAVFNGSAAVTFGNAGLKDIYAAADAAGYENLRKKFSAYLQAGTLEKGTVTLAFPDAVKEETPAEAVTADLRFKNAEIYAPKNNIRLKGIDGSAEFWDKTLTARIKGGKGAGYTLERTDIIAELNKNSVSVKGGLTGTVAGLAAVTPENIQRRSRALTYLLTRAKADVKATFDITAPLNTDASRKGVFSIDASFGNASLPSLFPRADMTGGNFTAEIRPGRYTKVKGRAQIKRRAERTELDAAPFVMLPDTLVTLEESADIDLTLSPAHTKEIRRARIELTVDATDGTLRSPLFDYTKPQGTPGRLTLTGLGQKGAFTVDNLHYSAGEHAVHATDGYFSREKVSLSGPSFTPGGINSAFDFRTLSQDEARLSLEGGTPALDTLLAALKKHKATSNAPQKLRKLTIDADVRSLTYKGRRINNLRGTLTCIDGYCGAITAEGTLKNGGALNISLRPENGRFRKGALRLTAAPAAPLIATFAPDIHMKGGNAELSAVLTGTEDGPELAGDFDVHNVRLLKMPALSKLLAAASLRGAGDLVSGADGLAMDRLHIPFIYAADTVTVKNATTSGAAIGFTGGGTYELAEKYLDVEGVIIPAPGGVNKMVSEIPLIGDLLAGGRNKGILGVNYRVTGAPGDLRFSVNPLSLLAPGILRQLFPAQ